MILVFWLLSFKPAFSLSSFIFIFNNILPIFNIHLMFEPLHEILRVMFLLEFQKHVYAHRRRQSTRLLPTLLTGQQVGDATSQEPQPHL